MPQVMETNVPVATRPLNAGGFQCLVESFAQGGNGIPSPAWTGKERLLGSDETHHRRSDPCRPKERDLRRTSQGCPCGQLRGERREQGGAEELATAQKFLDARPGAARDSREAAQWLWKAVAKQNATATFLLSDLYLRGDGVSKNCDQGRLLLDAAARKGVAAAAERLRHLQAFGCQ